MKVKTNKDRRNRIRLRQRQRIQGTATRPRLAVSRSLGPYLRTGDRRPGRANPRVGIQHRAVREGHAA